LQIKDFWKEALILSSLYHPNIVSFYGVIHDGPDGSLATVTEFMPSGSLEQFLRKTNRYCSFNQRTV
jgi:serine/threonine protein kinase